MYPRQTGKILTLLCVSVLVACGGSGGSSEKRDPVLIEDVRAYRDNSPCVLPDFTTATRAVPRVNLDLADLTDEDFDDLFDDLLTDLGRDIDNFLDDIDLSAYEAEYESARLQVEQAANILGSLKDPAANLPYPAANFPGETWGNLLYIPNENFSDRLRLRVHREREANRVSVGFVVTDELGLALNEITPDQIVVEGFNELGEKVEEYQDFRFSNVLADVVAELEHLAVSAVNDYSGSMANELDEVEFSLDGFYRIFPDQSQTEIIKFNDQTFIYYSMALADGPDLETAIRRRPELSMTAMYDAVTAGIVNLCTQPGYRAVLALTDGRDNASSVTIEETIAFARANQVPVYVIGFGYADKRDLKKLTEETGGAYLYFPYQVYQQLVQTQGQKPWAIAYSLMSNLYLYDYLIELANVSTAVTSIRVSVRTDTDFKSASTTI